MSQSSVTLSLKFSPFSLAKVTSVSHVRIPAVSPHNKSCITSTRRLCREQSPTASRHHGDPHGQLPSWRANMRLVRDSNLANAGYLVGSSNRFDVMSRRIASGFMPNARRGDLIWVSGRITRNGEALSMTTAEFTQKPHASRSRLETSASKTCAAKSRYGRVTWDSYIGN